MGFWTFFWIFVGIAILGAILKIIGESLTKKEITGQLDAEHPNTMRQIDGDGTYIAIDQENRKIIFGRQGLTQPYKLICDPQDIAQVTITQDGNTISSTNRGSQLAGAAIGGLALGGVGALIGGLSGSSTSKGTVVRIGLQLTVDNLQHPFHDITFFKAEDSKGVKLDTFMGLPARRALEKVNQFNATIVVMMREVQNKDQSTPKELHSPSTMAQQIKELWDLKEVGIITAEEFEAKKQSLLGN